MKVVNPYLNFPGNTEEAFNFYKSVFGGEFSMLMRMKDAKGMPVLRHDEETRNLRVERMRFRYQEGHVVDGSHGAQSVKRGTLNL